MPNKDVDKVMETLSKHESLNFVQRILSPEKYPALDLEDGSKATHLMAWGESDGKYYVYPTVVNVGEHLEQLDPDAAFDYAAKSGERIEFDNPEDADWFSRNYKLIWPEGR